MKNIIAYLTFCTMIISQNFPNLGSQDSFDFMTWNIEWFQKMVRPPLTM